MKITAQRADAVARSPGPDLRTVLVFGPNAGLVAERVDALVRSVVEDPGDPFRVGKLSGGELLADRARLRDEADALSLTGGGRVVIVRDAGDATASIFEQFLAESARQTLVIAQSGDLTARSSLRKAFETARAAAAIACYDDDEAGRASFLRQCLAEQGVTANAEVLDFMTASMDPDRALARNTVAKLVLHAGTSATITLDAARALVEDSAAASLDDVALAVADGDLGALSRALDRTLQAGAAPVAVLRASQRHFHRLHRILGARDHGGSIDGAIAALRPQVFWRLRARLVAQARNWATRDVASALEALTDAELSAKTTGMPDIEICGQALMGIARRVRCGPRNISRSANH